MAEFDTTIQWRELHRLLKVEFPVDVRAENAIHEIQFGYVERPTHRSRGYDQQRFEVCNHRYTALCDNSHGCAVLNDCKYGVGVEQNSIELTLLRAAASPEMASDQGEHRFRYGFTAWSESFAQAPVVQQAAAFNDPVWLEAGSLQAFSAFSTDAANVVIDTVKRADDESGDLILRLYETDGQDGSATVKLWQAPKSAQTVDLHEEPCAGSVQIQGQDVVVAMPANQVVSVRIDF